MVNKPHSATELEAFMELAASWQIINHNLLEGVDIKEEMQQYLSYPAMDIINMNHQQQKFLLDLCRKDMIIIENKRLDTGIAAVKNKAWKIIYKKFSNQFGTDRTCNRLREQWRRIKACTRNVIFDYNNLLALFGPQVARFKKPSSFEFEVWDFMQAAKKACKSEALDGIDYSKIPLALEEDSEYREDDQSNEEDYDMYDSRTPPQELCDVDINEETLNEAYNGNAEMSHDLERSSVHSPTNLSKVQVHAIPGPPAFLAQGGNDLTGFQPGFNNNNISATFEALNAVRTGQFPSVAAAATAAWQNNFAAHHQQQQQQQQQVVQAQHQQHTDDDELSPPAKRPRNSSVIIAGDSGTSVLGGSDPQQNSNSKSVIASVSYAKAHSDSSPELKAFMEMQSKEHMMRMRILEVQLQAAKYRRDLFLQKLQ